MINFDVNVFLDKCHPTFYIVSSSMFERVTFSSLLPKTVWGETNKILCTFKTIPDESAHKLKYYIQRDQYGFNFILFSNGTQ